jgi:hypothetical protein
MADKTRSDSDAAHSKRGTLSEKNKSKQPFDRLSFPTQSGEGLKQNIEGMKQSSDRESRQAQQTAPWD